MMIVSIRLAAIAMLSGLVLQGANAQYSGPSKLRIADTNDAPLGGSFPDDPDFKLPGDRVVPWNPGVRGGIPNYPTAVNVKDAPYNAKGDGITDDFSAITNAIAHCTNGGAVYFPAGTYRTTKQIALTSAESIVLRGAGPSQTIIAPEVNYGDAYVDFNIGTLYTSGATTGTVTNFTRGSFSFQGSIASGLKAGSFIRVYQNNDPLIITGACAKAQGMGQLFQVTNVSGNTISVSTPAYFSWTNQAYSPSYQKYAAPTTNCGFESFKIDCRGTSRRGLFLYVTANCWATNVVVTNSGQASFCLEQAFRCTVQGCTGLTPQKTLQSRYNFQVYNWSTDNLVTDNVADGGSSGFLCQAGSCGNVFSYNYVHRGFEQTTPTLAQRNGLVNHGVSWFNLWEGNIAMNAAVDCYWGNNNCNTFFRNWLRRHQLNEYNTNVTHFVYTLDVQAMCYSNSFVGNVLASPEDSGKTLGYHWMLNDPSQHDCNSVVYPSDPLVDSTTILAGNFDFTTGNTSWVNATPGAWPKSYYLAQKPSWFGNLAWPPVGPDVNITSTITNRPVIPAQARFIGVSY